MHSIDINLPSQLWLCIYKGVIMYNSIQLHVCTCPHSWEDCKQLMLTQNFFESLRFFDKDNVSPSKLRCLEKRLEGREKMSPTQVGQASQAAVPLLMWLVALLDYRKMTEKLRPHQKKQEEAEQILMKVYLSPSCIHSVHVRIKLLYRLKRSLLRCVRTCWRLNKLWNRQLENTKKL